MVLVMKRKQGFEENRTRGISVIRYQLGQLSQLKISIAMIGVFLTNKKKPLLGITI